MEGRLPAVPLAGVPPPGTPVPDVARRLAGDEPVRAVWLNQTGGLTCEIGTGVRRRFLKWSPRGSGVDLAAEEHRLRWASAYSSVPLVLDSGSEADGTWLLTQAVPGASAVADRWKRKAQVAAAGIGAGLRALHDALPVQACPFSWQAGHRVDDARRLAAAGLVDPQKWHLEHCGLTVDEALRRVAEPPAVDVLVVCHGDACAPNTLLDGAGCCTGHVDLGALGAADRWADLAVATWSVEWNYGPGLDDVLLEAYGVSPDPERTAYYRLLWDLGP